MHEAPIRQEIPDGRIQTFHRPIWRKNWKCTNMDVLWLHAHIEIIQIQNLPMFGSSISLKKVHIGLTVNGMLFLLWRDSRSVALGLRVVTIQNGVRDGNGAVHGPRSQISVGCILLKLVVPPMGIVAAVFTPIVGEAGPSPHSFCDPLLILTLDPQLVGKTNQFLLGYTECCRLKTNPKAPLALLLLIQSCHSWVSLRWETGKIGAKTLGRLFWVPVNGGQQHPFPPLTEKKHPLRTKTDPANASEWLNLAGNNNYHDRWTENIVMIVII